MLNNELNDRDIPHRTKIRSQIIELWNLHICNLGKEMRVSYNYVYYFIFLFIIYYRKHLERFHLQLTVGLIPTLHHLWLSLHIG